MLIFLGFLVALGLIGSSYYFYKQEGRGFYLLFVLIGFLLLAAMVVLSAYYFLG
ncbi:hypothetical protein [Aerococcus urinae]|uniref:Uncharacterized protein n=1 Tax=Aerococcus urinae TaxID=1376 RepID=A0A7T2RRY4_9LACT|nr:hypothetical protein [Aerococcus urinae]MCY3033293.1 hypothetical protein [Aerococcus urinae]MCY3038356.1 hypothetical protein [Aerococcus urinae]MCY3045258.1 hypothetical protein [Aerococcus urinae]MCY3046848.1 hypothetical protein [Aerococcus urinae]MCY3048794.1 hypothetical protein [Aerococcus urinae]